MKAMNCVAGSKRSKMSQLGGEPIVLHDAGRPHENASLRQRCARSIFARLRGDRVPEMELIARSISSIEPGGAHMIDLARAFLNGPNEDVRAGARRA